MLHLQPRNRFEDLESVYLVGGGTHPGNGLPVIFESARITSRLIGEELGMAVAVDGDDRASHGRFRFESTRRDWGFQPVPARALECQENMWATTSENEILVEK